MNGLELLAAAGLGVGVVLAVIRIRFRDRRDRANQEWLERWDHERR